MQDKSMQTKENKFLAEFSKFINSAIISGLITQECADDLQYLCVDYLSNEFNDESKLQIDEFFTFDNELGDEEYN
jgi:hypothetical protein